MAHQGEEFDERFEDLKRQVKRQAKWLRLSTIGWMSVLGIISLAAAYRPSVQSFDSITVHRLGLIDSNGVERLILDTDNRLVHLKGKDQKRGPQVSGIILQNEKGDEAGGLVTGNCVGLEKPCLATAALMLDSETPYGDKGGTERVGFFSREDGLAGMVLVDLKGQTRSLFATDAQLSASLSLNDSNGKSQIAGSVGDNGKAEWNAPRSSSN